MAKAKNIFLSSKEIEKDLKGRALESLASFGAGIGTSLLLQTVKDKITNENAQKFVSKFGGVVAFAGGTVANVFSNNRYVHAAALGMTAIGGVQTMFDMNVSFASKLSLSAKTLPEPKPLKGIEEFEEIELEGLEEEELNRLAAQLNLIETSDIQMNGIENEQTPDLF